MNEWNENTIHRARFDYPLLIAVVALTMLGLTMVFSASAVLAQEKFGDGFFYLKKMLVYAVLGYVAMACIMRIPYSKWKGWVYPLLLVSLVVTGLALFSGMGVKVGGARRWLALGPITFQPSELAKIAVILFMAYSMEKKREKMQKFSVGIVPNIIIPGLLVIFVLAGKDLGTSFVMATLILTMLFLGGANLKHLGLLSLMALPILYKLISGEGYRLRRFLIFLNPWGDQYGAGFQVIQSFLAFNEGGISGKGLGAGQQKLFYLPEAHTDFIFSVLGEELGLVGVVATIGAFLFFCYRGLKIATHAPDLFGRYIAFGIVILIAVQSTLNMGVVMGLLPTKGLVLPFVSYGGSALVMTLVAVGILLNISTYQKADTPPMFTGR
ncbi:MAG: putative lipid II flippase FtsW [Deltaproteobacteria bacterium]|nr:putative lipid II flippase FtsW [Deltaproteobacteria bacterium]